MRSDRHTSVCCPYPCTGCRRPGRSRHRSYDSCRTAAPDRHASAPRSCRCGWRRRTSPCRSSGRGPPESPDTAPRNPRTDSASDGCGPPPPPRSRGPYGLPARGTHGNGGMDGSSSPSGERSTTGCTPSEDPGRTGYPSRRDHRTASPTSGGRTSAPAVC